jgi:hypothetical protein
MKNCVFTLFLLSAIVSNGQVFLNLDFEYAGYKDQPRKWVTEGEGKFTAHLDTSKVHSGKRSLSVELKDAQTYTFLSLPRNSIVGKTITVTGYINGSKSDSVKVILAFKDPNSKPTTTPIEEQVSGKWIQFTTSSTIPSNYKSDRLLFAVIMMGTGNVSLDNVSILIDGEPFGNGEPDFREPFKSEIDVIQKNASPFFLSQSNLPNIDLEIGDATIVGLGENSHGSSFFQLKNELVKYLIQRKGFTVFALESPVIEADKITNTSNMAQDQSKRCRTISYIQVGKPKNL